MGDQEKFLQLLAKQINRGSDKFTFESLKKYFVEAVGVLPKGNLKDVLQKQSEENADHIWNLIKPAKKCSPAIEFNIFSEDGLEATLNKVSQHHSCDEQIRYLSQAALFNPCNKVYELLLTAQKNKSPDLHQHEVLRKATELYGRLTVGCQNSEVLNGLMRAFLSEIGKVNDKFRTSDEANESWLDFKDIIHCFLIHCHMKQKVQEEKHCKDEVKDCSEYRDCLAAIIAIYIDVIIAIGKIHEDVSNHISNIVYLLLADSPSHILDTGNQIFTLNSDTVKIIFPFLRKVLETSKTCTTEYPNYLKYVCLAWKVKNCASEEEMTFLRKSVYSLPSPENFLSWFADVDSSLLQDFGLSGLVRQRITKKILQCDDEEAIEKLLDLASSPEKWRGTSEDHNKDVEDTEESETNDVLFFVDAQGSSELLQQCQEEEFTNSRNDKILKSQITALLEKREQAASENEEEDFDIILDDNGTTFEVDCVNSEQRKSDEGPDQSVKPDDGTEREEESALNVVTSPEEDVERSGKKRRKRKSQPSSAVSEEQENRGKSSRKRVLRKRRSLSKTT